MVVIVLFYFFLMNPPNLELSNYYTTYCDLNRDRDKTKYI
jgi:hypothetical protein